MYVNQGQRSVRKPWPQKKEISAFFCYDSRALYIMEILLLSSHFWNGQQGHRWWAKGDISCKGPLTWLMIIVWLYAYALWWPKWCRHNEDIDRKKATWLWLIHIFCYLIGKSSRDMAVIPCILYNHHFYLSSFIKFLFILLSCFLSGLGQVCFNKRIMISNAADLWCWFLQTTWKSRRAQPAWLSSGDCWSPLWRHGTSPGSPQTLLGCFSPVFSCAPS